MPEVKPSEVEYWVDQLKKLHKAYDSANENGLFDDDPEVYKTAIAEIAIALDGLSEKSPKIIEAKKKHSIAFNNLNLRSNLEKFKWWRFSFYYGGPVLIYLIIFFVAILFVWFFFENTLLNHKILWVPSWAFLWGAMGGILNGFWKVWQHACFREIRKVWYTWYIALPLMGAILGALAYLIVLAGLIAITGKSEIESQFFIMLLCALAGFSAKWAVNLLDKITKMIQIKE